MANILITCSSRHRLRSLKSLLRPGLMSLAGNELRTVSRLNSMKRRVGRNTAQPLPIGWHRGAGLSRSGFGLLEIRPFCRLDGSAFPIEWRNNTGNTISTAGLSLFFSGGEVAVFEGGFGKTWWQ